MTDFYQSYKNAVDRFIGQALQEDIEAGDHSSNACFNDATVREAVLKVKNDCVIAGIELAEKIFHHYDVAVEMETLVKEGDVLQSEAVAFRVKGKAKSLLPTERLVLNCMQRMSGIATLSRRLSEKIKHTDCKILDTRKTTPGFRYPEKWAVSIGGGYNHRMGLFDAIMIKDNHIDFCGGVKPALIKTKAYLDQNQYDIPVIVEVRNDQEITQVMDFPWVKRILLDNMTPKILAEKIEKINGKFETEASGNITEDTLLSYAETGVNYVSMGAITYGAIPIDLSLKAV
ncbi:MAG: carboxylating nicotinate-nucleotide diphosphorylase [Bacteroidetes bacterium]|nr:carboxylating nicotinate-nucleotide diphosphorylase [Bacteroidota bacterium]MDA0936354.1 carboxylating nicotinate-nucleotide diphosphorylase [Bacteroidota bacterium]